MGFLYLMSLDKSDSLDDWVWRWWVWLLVIWYVRFSMRFDKSVGCVSGLMSSFFLNRIWVQMWRYFISCVCTNRSHVQRWSTHRNVLGLKFLIIPQNFKTSFIAIVMLWLCCTLSDHCRFTKKCYGDIQRYPYFDLWILVAGVPMTPLSFDVLMTRRPKSTNCGASV